jgi:hypothetical protein
MLVLRLPKEGATEESIKVKAREIRCEGVDCIGPRLL